MPFDYKARYEAMRQLNDELQRQREAEAEASREQQRRENEARRAERQLEAEEDRRQREEAFRAIDEHHRNLGAFLKLGEAYLTQELHKWYHLKRSNPKVVRQLEKLIKVIQETRPVMDSERLNVLHYSQAHQARAGGCRRDPRLGAQAWANRTAPCSTGRSRGLNRG